MYAEPAEHIAGHRELSNVYTYGFLYLSESDLRVIPHGTHTVQVVVTGNSTDHLATSQMAVRPIGRFHRGPGESR